MGSGKLATWNGWWRLADEGGKRSEIDGCGAR